ncbi:hypothetical protein BDV98DRAFT_485386, partial [Pterulicium gracile]
FCPEELQDVVLAMVKWHYCAHLSIGRTLTWTKEGIHSWAVKNMYQFCIKHKLPELWACMWKNWYWEGHWELWAQCKCKETPHLKTTMVCKAHWHQIKVNILTHFNKLQVDCLTWALTLGLAKTYYHKLN